MKIKFLGLILFLIFPCSLVALRPRAYFGPAIRAKIIQLINDEKKCIKVAMYTFTDIVIAQALIEAFKRGVRIECIVDGFTNCIKSGRAFHLKKIGVPVMQYLPSRYGGLMHNNNMIFSQTHIVDTMADTPCVITGSYNCTYNATFNNCENMVMISDKKIISRFNENFKNIKKESFYISKALERKRTRD